MSLRATSRNDSKLVIYGAGGLASQDDDSTQATPNHHTLKLDLRNATVHHAEPSMATLPPRGSITDVEHKSVGALLGGSSSYATRTSHGSTDHSTVTSGGEGQRSLVQEVGSPIKSLVIIDREERHLGNHKHSSVSQGSLERSMREWHAPSPKQEWYQDPSPSTEHARSFHDQGSGSGGIHRASSSTAVQLPHQKSSGHFQRQESNEYEQNHRHGGSTEHFHREGSAKQMRRFYHSQSVDQIEYREKRSHHSSSSKHRHHHRHHHHYHPERDSGASEENGSNWSGSRSHNRQHLPAGRSRSSSLGSDITERRKKSTSLPRDTPPRLQEEDEAEGQSASRYVDRNHPAKPQNRGQYRLSLPESTYYDSGNRLSRQSHARRSHKTLSNVSIVSSGSLSQPMDFNLWVSVLN